MGLWRASDLMETGKARRRLHSELGERGGYCATKLTGRAGRAVILGINPAPLATAIMTGKVVPHAKWINQPQEVVLSAYKNSLRSAS